MYFTQRQTISDGIFLKMTFLNKNAQVKYQDMQIDADYISIDDNKNLIYARGKLDSLGKIIEPVITTQAGKI